MLTGPTKSYSGLYNLPIYQSEWPNKARTVLESLVTDDKVRFNAWPNVYSLESWNCEDIFCTVILLINN